MRQEPEVLSPQPGGCDAHSEPVRREAVERPVRGSAADRSVGGERASHPPGRPQSKSELFVPKRVDRIQLRGPLRRPYPRGQPDRR